MRDRIARSWRNWPTTRRRRFPSRRTRGLARWEKLPLDRRDLRETISSGRHLHLATAAEIVHQLHISRHALDLTTIMPAQRIDEPPVARKKLVRELDHAGVRPGLRPDLDQTREETVLALLRLCLSHQGQHGSRRAGNSHVTMDQKMSLDPLVTPLRHFTTKAQNGLHMLGLRQDHALHGLDDVVEAQDRPMMRIIGLERLGVRMVRIEDRENMGHGPLPLVRQFRDAADREHLYRLGLHQSTRSEIEMGQK